MRGLTVRWSLADADAGVLERLSTYVEETSHARFTGSPVLAYKTWRARPGEWFDGCYVFSDDAARARFPAAQSASGAHSFLATSNPSPTGSRTGTSPSWSRTALPSSRIATVSSSR